MTIEHDGKKHEAFLGDDGTMDTVIIVDGKEHRFDCEYASQHRDDGGAMTESGFKELATEVIESDF